MFTYIFVWLLAAHGFIIFMLYKNCVLVRIIISSFFVQYYIIGMVSVHNERALQAQCSSSSCNSSSNSCSSSSSSSSMGNELIMLLVVALWIYHQMPTRLLLIKRKVDTFCISPIHLLPFQPIIKTIVKEMIWFINKLHSIFYIDLICNIYLKDW